MALTVLRGGSAPHPLRAAPSSAASVDSIHSCSCVRVRRGFPRTLAGLVHTCAAVVGREAVSTGLCWPRAASAGLCGAWSSPSRRPAWHCFHGRAGVRQGAAAQASGGRGLEPAPSHFLHVLLARAGHRWVTGRRQALGSVSGWAGLPVLCRMWMQKPLTGAIHAQVGHPSSLPRTPIRCYCPQQALPILKLSLPQPVLRPLCVSLCTWSALEGLLASLVSVPRGYSAHMSPRRCWLNWLAASQASVGHTPPPSGHQAFVQQQADPLLSYLRPHQPRCLRRY